jgi:hypothetical protein
MVAESIGSRFTMLAAAEPVKLQLARLTSRGRRRYQRRFVLNQFPKHSIGAEIGVFQGGYSTKMLEVVKPKRLHLIDPWIYERGVLPQGVIIRSQDDVDDIYRSVTERFRVQLEAGQVVVHRMTSGSASSGFEDSSLDWIYIDGNHDYEFVLQDLRLYVSKMKPGGLIAGDDYRADKYGVKQAVDQFVGENDVELILARNTQFLLRKISPGCRRVESW